MGRSIRIFGSAVGVAILFLFLGSTPSLSQTQVLLRGSVTDPSGSAIPNATIHLINPSNNSDRTATTDQTGKYAFQDVAPGNYRLAVEAAGFDRYEQSDIHVLANAPALDVKMTIKQVQQNVTVRGQAGDECLASRAHVLPDLGPGLRALRRGPSGNYYALTAPGAAAAIYSPNGKRIGQVPAASSAGPAPGSAIEYGSDLQIDSTGRVYVADRAANAIKIYSADGILVRKIRVPAPISVEPLNDGDVAVASLLSQHWVDVYDAAKGEAYRSFGDVINHNVEECDTETLRCAVHVYTGELSDAKHNKMTQAPVNHSWFYGDSAGNVYVDIDPDTTTFRKYDGYGYLAFESTYPPLGSGQNNASWKVNPEVRLAGLGAIEAMQTDNTSQTNPNSSSADATSGTDPRFTGGRPMMGDGGMHGVGGGGEGFGGGTHGGGMGHGGSETSRMGFGVRFAQRAGPTGQKAVIDAISVDPATEDVWAAIGGELVHFDKDGKYAGDYCLSSSDQAPVKPTTLIVEPNRILIGTDPFGVFEYARPDKQ